MSGPVTMTLGSYAFEALGGLSYKDVKRKLHTPWADIPVAMRMHAAHWVGPKGEDVTIHGVLFPAVFGGTDSLEGIRASAKAGIPQPLITLDGAIHGLFRIEEVDEDRTAVNAQGVPQKDAYSITLKLLDDNGFGSWTSLILAGLSLV